MRAKKELGGEHTQFASGKGEFVRMESRVERRTGKPKSEKREGEEKGLSVTVPSSNKHKRERASEKLEIKRRTSFLLALHTGTNLWSARATVGRQVEWERETQSERWRETQRDRQTDRQIDKQTETKEKRGKGSFGKSDKPSANPGIKQSPVNQSEGRTPFTRDDMGFVTLYICLYVSTCVYMCVDNVSMIVPRVVIREGLERELQGN
jgi:hypothetical protein